MKEKGKYFHIPMTMVGICEDSSNFHKHSLYYGLTVKCNCRANRERSTKTLSLCLSLSLSAFCHLNVYVDKCIYIYI